MLTPQQAGHLVRKGISRLEKAKKNWFKKIDLDLLDMASLRNCMLGQLFGDFGVGASALGIVGLAHQYGFDVNSTMAGSNSTDYPVLEAAWRRAIQKRLAA